MRRTLHFDKASARPLRARRGFTAVYVAVMLVILVGFVALGVDIGRLQLAKTELQVAADAAARAAVWDIPTATPAAWTSAQDKAILIGSLNTADNVPITIDRTQDIEFGVWNRSTRSFFSFKSRPDLWPSANAILVTTKRLAARSAAIPYVFAPVLGHNQGDASASAIAMIRGGAPNGYGFGIVGIDNLSMNGITATDSYNPRLGPYGGTNVHDGGTVASNNDIDLVGTVTINGDARPGPNYPANPNSPTANDDIIDKNANSTITGWQAPLDAELNFPNVSIPSVYNNSPLASTGYFNSSTRDFSINGHGSVDIPGGTTANPAVYYINNFTVNGNSTINFTGPVKIYVSGTVDLTGNVAVNQGLPANFQLFVIGAGNVDLGGGTSLAARVYAPQSDVRFHGTGSSAGLFGAVVGRTLEIDGNSAIHFDETTNFNIGAGGPFFAEIVK